MKVLLILALLIPIVVYADNEKVLMSALTWHPYAAKDMPNNGLLVHTISVIMNSMERELQVDFYNWVTFIAMAIDTKEGYAGYMPERYPETMKDTFTCSNPVIEVPFVLISRKDFELKDGHHANYLIASVSEIELDKNEQYMRQLYPHSEFIDVGDYHAILQGIKDETFDLGYIDAFIYYNLIHKEPGFRNLNIALKIGHSNMHVCFNDDSTGILNHFNKQLHSVDTKEIIDNYLKTNLNVK